MGHRRYRYWDDQHRHDCRIRLCSSEDSQTEVANFCEPLASVILFENVFEPNPNVYVQID